VNIRVQPLILYAIVGVGTERRSGRHGGLIITGLPLYLQLWR
jgi:hypothetical protein